MRAILFVLLLVTLATVSADVGASSALKVPSTARAIQRKAKVQQQSRVEVIGAATKQASSGFDSKAAIQLVTTFGIWYGFNAACKCDQ